MKYIRLTKRQDTFSKEQAIENEKEHKEMIEVFKYECG